MSPYVDFGAAWCATCGRSVEVLDAFDEARPTRTGEQPVWVQRLVCGHSIVTDRGREYREPSPVGLPKAWTS